MRETNSLTNDGIMLRKRGSSSYMPSTTRSKELAEEGAKLGLETRTRETSTPSAVSTAGDPEKCLIAKEQKEAVWKALSEIEEEAREIIILKHFQDMSYKEISEVLGIPAGSVMSRLHYARLKLKKALGENF